MNEWYTEIDEDAAFSQGEIIFNCPVIIFSSPGGIEEGIELEANSVEKDVIILTQACDIENRKVDNILLAEIISEPNKDEAKQANAGRSPRYHLLNKKEEIDGCEIVINDYMLIDFSNVFTLPLEFFESQLKFLGKRLRLNTPYIEYVSQRFGAYYARIGLPNAISSHEIDEHYKK